MEFDKTGRINFKAFYLRRVLRILPPFYLVLTVASLLTFTGLLEGSLQSVALLFQAFHLSNYYVIYNGWWTGRAPGTWIFWSLAVEEHFYLIFPLVYLCLRRYVPSRRNQMIVLASACAAVLIWRCLLVWMFHASKDRTYMATDTRLDSILFGCILAVFGNPMLDESRISERHWKRLWFPLGLVALVVSFAIRSSALQETFRYTLQGLALFPLFVGAIRYATWGIFRILNVGWIKFIGLLSYSLYLVHPIVIYGVQQWTGWHPVAVGIMASALSLALAIAIYRLIEQPCAELRKRLSRPGSSSAISV